MGSTPVTTGYCPHGSPLFGPWHRPYIVVFEQILAQQAQTIAAQFPTAQRTAYQAAANTLRWPYWDWAMRPANNGPVVPASVSSATISVTYPNGTTATVANPLYSYRFHPLTASDFSGNGPNFAQQPQTVRNPANGASASASSRPAVLESSLASQTTSYRSRLFTLFSTYQPYNYASNKGSGGTLDNFESIHDAVHGSFGSGHMAYVSVAAFDPIFWLHHTNIDRVLAIWQKIYPNTYIDPARQPSSTYVIRSGTTVDVNYALSPFHSTAAGAFHTSATARQVETFGYTYPEIQGNPSNATVINSVTQLYGSSARALLAKRDDDKKDEKKGSKKGDGKARDYLTKIRIPWTALEGSYSVAVFLGEYNADPTTWATEPNFVGSHATLASQNTTPNDVIIPGTIKLNDALRNKYDSGELENIDESSIVDYLKKNLHWAIQKQGAAVPRGDVAKLKVIVESVVVKPAAAGGFPTWVPGSTKKYSDITDS